MTATGESPPRDGRGRDVVVRVQSFSRNQTGANLLASLAADPAFSAPLLVATTPGTIEPNDLFAVASAARSARFAANRAKAIGMLWIAVALALLATALLWPAIEKLAFKAQESLLTGIVQAAFTLLGGVAGSLYLRAKRRQSGIEGAMRMLLFEHAPLAPRLQRLVRVIRGEKEFDDEPLSSASVAQAELSDAPSVQRLLEPLIGRKATMGEALAFAAQMKELSIKRYAWRVTSACATAAAIALFLLAIVLPFVPPLIPGVFDDEIARTLQPMLGVALPVFFLAFRQQALTKTGELDAAVASLLRMQEPMSAKAARGIEALAAIDRGMTMVAEQLPRLGSRKQGE